MLRQNMPELLSLSYDYVNPDHAYQKISTLIEEILDTDEHLILAGTSLGGFWANYFAQLYELKCVIVNPVLHPSITLQKAIPFSPLKNFYSAEERIFTYENALAYKKYEVGIKPNPFRTVVLAKNDEVLDYTETEKFYRGKGKIIYTEEGHTIRDHQRIAGIIKEAMLQTEATF
jgi:predicted esterase YcpF (UPF0227 family)